MYARSPRNLNMDRFSWPNHLILPLCLIRKFVAFKSSTKFFFSTSYNLNTAKLQKMVAAAIAFLTLHLSMMPRPRLMPDNRPFLELRSIILQEKWKPEIRWIRTTCATGPEKHRSVGRVIVRKHLNRTVGRGGLGTSEIKHWTNLGIDYVHHILNVLYPNLESCPAARTVDFG